MNRKFVEKIQRHFHTHKQKENRKWKAAKRAVGNDIFIGGKGDLITVNNFDYTGWPWPYRVDRYNIKFEWTFFFLLLLRRNDCKILISVTSFFSLISVAKKGNYRSSFYFLLLYKIKLSALNTRILYVFFFIVWPEQT